MLRHLREGNGLRFREDINSRLYAIMEEKLIEFKKLVAARYFSEETGDDFPKKKDDNKGTDDQDDGDGSDTSEQLEVLKQGCDDADADEQPKKKV